MEVGARLLFVVSASGCGLRLRMERTGRSMTHAFVEAAVGGVFAGVASEW